MAATTSGGSAENYLSLKPYLFTVAYRMTGSVSDAEDLVQDAWVRYFDAGQPEVISLRAWLTTAVTRLAIDHLRLARVQRVRSLDVRLPAAMPASGALADPEHTAEAREGVTLAYLTLLDHLTPAQRIVYVLRVAFDFSYQDIAAHTGKPADACRQIFRRARLRLAAANRPAAAPGPMQRQRAEPFLAAVATVDPARITTALVADVTRPTDAGRRASRESGGRSCAPSTVAGSRPDAGMSSACSSCR